MESKLPDTIFIAYITLLGYVTAFLFEASYTSFFGIPYYFIQIKLENILFSILIVLIVLVTLFGLLNLLDGLHIINNNFYGRFRALMLVMFLFTAPLALFGNFHQYLIFTLLLIILVLLLEIGLPLEMGKGGISWKEKRTIVEEKIKANRKKQLDEYKDSFLTFVLSRLKIFPLEILVVTIFFSYTAICSGFILASYQTEFYVINTDAAVHVILIRKYGDLLLTVPVNQNTKTFDTKLYIINGKDLSPDKYVMDLQNIGPLKQPVLLRTETKNTQGFPSF